MPRSRLVWLLASAMAAVLAGCGNASSSPTVTEHALAQPTMTPEATTPASPTPAASATAHVSRDALATAAAAYVAAVAPINTVGEMVFSAEDALPDEPFTAHVPYEQQWLTALQGFDASVHQIAWPPSVQSIANDMYSAVDHEILAERAFLADPNAATWDALGQALSGGASASADIRRALHLPVVSDGSAPTA